MKSRWTLRLLVVTTRTGHTFRFWSNQPTVLNEIIGRAVQHYGKIEASACGDAT